MNLKVAGTLLALAIVLPGCTGTDTKTSEASATTATSGTASGTGNDTGPAANVTENHPPVANLTSDVVNGSLPLNVNFTIAASDPDAGDNVTWSLDADADGKADASGPANQTQANFTYTVAGIFNATLNVTDGKNTTSSVVSINVTAGERVPVELATYTASGIIAGAYVLTNDPMMAVQCPGFIAGVSGDGCVFLPFTKGPHNGLPGIITTNAGNVRMAFWSECKVTGTGTGFFGGSSGGRVTIPAGTGCAVLWSSSIPGDVGQTRSFTLKVYDWLPPVAAA